MPTPPKPIRVAIAVVTSNGQVLVSQRLANVDLPGLWEFPGGKIEPGETAEQAAVREVGEELGITVEATATLAALEHTYPHAHVTLTPVLCRHTAGEPVALQCAGFRWVAPTDLATLPMPAGNATLLHVLAERLCNKDMP